MDILLSLAPCSCFGDNRFSASVEILIRRKILESFSKNTKNITGTSLCSVVFVKLLIFEDSSKDKLSDFTLGHSYLIIRSSSKRRQKNEMRNAVII